MGSEDDVLDNVVVPPDLPLEAIAEEMQNSWHLKVRCTHAPRLTPADLSWAASGFRRSPFEHSHHTTFCLSVP